MLQYNVSYFSRIWNAFHQFNTFARVSVFLGFYIMSQFRIAELARRGTVKKVNGPSRQQVAYQIGPAFNFRINTRWDAKHLRALTRGNSAI